MVFEKVRAILCEQLDLDEDKITLESSIMDDLSADSLDLVDVIMSLEDEFGIDFDDEETDSIKTVGDLVKYVEANS